MALEYQDGDRTIRFAEGQSFGAHRSVAGELVFQTGMVGYPESLTDPSYRGQLLVVTFPLVGNYGVPSREDRDAILEGLPAHFESSQIHIAGLIVASYAGEDYSHHLASSSLGAWLKEQHVPAICGVDTRALTKRIREKGSMLGRLLMQTGTETISDGFTTPSGAVTPNGTMTPALTSSVSDLLASAGSLVVNGLNGTNGHSHKKRKRNPVYEEHDWYNPNTRNLVADGKPALPSSSCSQQSLIESHSLNIKAQSILPECVQCVEAPVR